MNLRFIGHSLALTFSTLIPWFWVNDKLLSPYTLQLAGATVVLYIATKFFLRGTNHKTSLDLTTLVFINALTQIIILSTGGITSPFFFLLFLLLFAVALLFEATQAAVIATLTSLLYIWQNYQNPSTTLFASIVELLLVTPLSIVFGKNYLRNLSSSGKIQILEEEIKNEETDSLLWITTNAKPSLASIINSLSEVVIYLNSTRHNLTLPKSLLNKMKAIQSDLIALYSSTDDLKNVLESESDNKSI